MEFFHFAILFGGFEGVHGGTVEASEEFDEIRRGVIGRPEVERVFDHGDVLLGNASLAEAIYDVIGHAPGHRTDEAFGRRGREG